MPARGKKRLILGSAGCRDENAVTLDINPKHKPDIIHDLNLTPWPVDDNAFGEIICHHVLEHLNDLSPAMEELYRICTGDGAIYIEVPHHTSWCANTPEHKLRFNYFAFDGYIEGGLVRWMTGRKKFTLDKREITFHKFFRAFLLHKLFNALPFTYERFLAYIFPAENLKICLRPVK